MGLLTKSEPDFGDPSETVGIALSGVRTELFDLQRVGVFIGRIKRWLLCPVFKQFCRAWEEFEVARRDPLLRCRSGGAT